MPAPASLSIVVVADHVGGLDLPDPVALTPGLRDMLGGVVDPRKRPGVRHGLVVVLTVAVCAVAAGARSFVAVAEWVADLPDEVATMLGTHRRCPSESTIRRVLGKIDADRFDAVIGAFVQGLCTQVAPAGRRRVQVSAEPVEVGGATIDRPGITEGQADLLAGTVSAARVLLAARAPLAGGAADQRAGCQDTTMRV